MPLNQSWQTKSVQHTFDFSSVPDRSQSVPLKLSAFSPLPKLYRSADDSSISRTRHEICSRVESPTIVEDNDDFTRPRRYFVSTVLSQLFPPKATKLDLSRVTPIDVEEHLKKNLPHLDGTGNPQYDASTARVIDTRILTQPYRQETPRERKRTEFKVLPPLLPRSPYGVASSAAPDASCLLRKDEEFYKLLEECEKGTAVLHAKNAQKAALETEEEARVTQSEASQKAIERLEEKQQKRCGSPIQEPSGNPFCPRSEPLRKTKEKNRSRLIEQREARIRFVDENSGDFSSSQMFGASMLMQSVALPSQSLSSVPSPTKEREKEKDSTLAQRRKGGLGGKTLSRLKPHLISHNSTASVHSSSPSPYASQPMSGPGPKRQR